MKPASRSAGFSLVLTLILLTLFAVLAISFLSTSTLDRMTARAFADKTQAELAADTAVSQAISLLADTITQYPDSATVWEPLPASAGGYGTEGTVLYYSDAAPGDANAKYHLLPLFSRGLDSSGQLPGGVAGGNKAAALGAEAWTADNSIDMNRPRSNEDQVGWIGTPPPPPPSKVAPTVPKPFRAKWIEVKEHPTAGNIPRVISRYAFWMEDESFKVNLNQLGAAKRNAEINSPGTLPQEIPIQGLMRSAHVPATVDADAIAAQARYLRDSFFGKRLLDLPSFNQPNLKWAEGSGPTSKTVYLGDQTKFLATVFSGGLNLSRHGSQRLNLNGLGFEKLAPTDAEYAKGVKQVVETIRHHAPTFYQRFYRLQRPGDANYKINDAQVAAMHQDPYLYKIAANIRDYIDPDLQPTMVAAPESPSTAPTMAARAAQRSAFGDDNEAMWAQGKEGLYLQEAAVRERIDTKADKLRYNLKLDYYIEFWNMTTRDISAGVIVGKTEPHALGYNPYLCIANQQAWLARKDGSLLRADNTPAGDPIQAPERDMVIDLVEGVFNKGQTATTGVVFKAGQCTVITTDPDYQTLPHAPTSVLPPGTPENYKQVAGGGQPNFSGGVNLDNIYYCSKLKAGKREYAGPIPGPWKSDTGGIKADFRDGTQDYDTEVILGNDLGYIDSLPCALAMSGGPYITNNALNEDWFGGSLFGNDTTPSQLGDPRTNNEQLTYTRFLSDDPATSKIDEPDQTRYFNATSKPRFSFGYPNSRYLNPQLTTKWPDYYKGWPHVSPGTGTADNPTGPTAPSFLANANLKSIGQLGDIFDPARVAGTEGTLGVGGSRGGGRSLKIGQKDDLADMTTINAASQQWAAWRLTDFLGTSSELSLPGLININGLRRDNGAALRAACYGMTLNVASWPGLAASVTTSDTTFDSEESEEPTAPAGLQRIINQAIKRLSGSDPTKPSYFRERGELSELDAYSSHYADIVSSAKGSDTFDRSREELFRRLSDLITTRGNIFSVYAVGQSIRESQDAARTKRVTGQHAVKVTFALLPRKADGSDFQVKQETFDPTKEKAIEDRFAKPHHYDVLFLQVTPQ